MEFNGGVMAGLGVSSAKLADEGRRSSRADMWGPHIIERKRKQRVPVRER
jgi:hypothetical protein